MAKRGLGKGLEALLPGLGADGPEIREIPLDRLEADPRQPRRSIDQLRLQELADSIRIHGVVQPVLVRALPEGRYQIIAGERRWRACALLGRSTLPAIVREVDDANAREIALIENLQREDLDPLEEAEAYQQLLTELGLTQEELSRRIGKSRSQIANHIRLLQLSPEEQELLRQGVLSRGHAKALLALPDPEQRQTLAVLAGKQQLSVRDLERLVRRQMETEGEKPSNETIATGSSPDWAGREERWRSRLDARVRIRWPRSKKGKGLIEIEIDHPEQLARLEALLGIGEA